MIQDLCIHCNRVTTSHPQRGAGRTTYHCSVCGNQTDCDYDDDYGDFADDEGDDEWEDALDECGLLPPHLGGGCTLAGTEHCDFDCPFRDTGIYGEVGPER